ncbi:ABC transporter ATP-binding protein [Yinghuangia seranimata]|uniref:ABC transporter ATP-binding protein n=1 Tax=Yinghuangia seranimata TaxID=408067 RepID=UPI00248AE3EC|nr:ABC transporter ATP-binding protein [Yinghuangia seranimata]MDI2130863.1 ABC transporter ATP-binding protein [Yinghuangia seranimata]
MKLELRGLRAVLGGLPVLDGVDLRVEEGEFVGLVGPNGSGKSTLLRTVYRSLRPAAGTVLVGDADVWRLSARAAALRTAAVLQDSPLPDGATASEVVALGRTPHHGLLDRDTARDRDVVHDALQRTGAAAFADRAATELSGGERQRVLLARALAQEPHVLLLDEPTNHLDIRARFELLGVIAELGLTTLAVLHDLDLAARMCDRLVVVKDGRIVAGGPVLDALTPAVLSDVFGVNARTDRHPDGVVRVTYDARPLACR